MMADIRDDERDALNTYHRLLDASAGLQGCEHLAAALIIARAIKDTSNNDD